jgi:hypothetical protein
MKPSQRLLLLGSLGVALWGMGYGLVYAVFIEHQTLDGLGAALAAGFMRAARRQMPETQAALADAAHRSYVYVRQVDAHSHWIGLALLLFVLGFALDRAAFSERTRLWLAAALLTGAILFPLGVLLETWNAGAVPQAIAILGSALLTFGLAALVWGFARSGVRPG